MLPRLAEEISKEVHALRSKEQGGTSTAFDTRRLATEINATSQDGSSNNGTPADAASVSDTVFEGSRAWLKIAQRDKARLYVLGNLTLDAGTVTELFNHFERHHLPYTIFLAPLASLSSLLKKSELLFWTIVLAATRTHEHFRVHFEQVAAEHTILLKQISQTAIERIDTIHALLILCLWPVPRSRQVHDPAWNYVSLSISASMQFGFHDPASLDSDVHTWGGFNILVGHKITPTAGALTWLSCFWIGTNIAYFQGLPAPISGTQHLRSVGKALKSLPDLIPGWWKTLILILEIGNTSTSTLEGVEDPALHLTITQTYDDQLEAVKTTDVDTWTPHLEMELCTAKLYLYAMTFTISVQPDALDDSRRQINRQMVLHKSLTAASRLIAAAISISDQPVASGFYPNGTLTFAPKQVFTSLMNATAFLFRFLATFTTPTPEQETLAMGSIIEAHKIFQSFPDNRDMMRAAIHTEMFVSILRDKRSPGSAQYLRELVLTNRLGASVMYDAIFRSSMQRNRDPATGASPPIQEWKTMNAACAERLPKAVWDSEGRESDKTGFSSAEGMPGLNVSSTELAVQDPSWWTDWDTYMEYFEVGTDGSWPDGEQSTGASGDLMG